MIEKEGEKKEREKWRLKLMIRAYVGWVKRKAAKHKTNKSPK